MLPVGLSPRCSDRARTMTSDGPRPRASAIRPPSALDTRASSDAKTCARHAFKTAYASVPWVQPQRSSSQQVGQDGCSGDDTEDLDRIWSEDRDTSAAAYGIVHQQVTVTLDGVPRDESWLGSVGGLNVNEERPRVARVGCLSTETTLDSSPVPGHAELCARSAASTKASTGRGVPSLNTINTSTSLRVGVQPPSADDP